MAWRWLRRFRLGGGLNASMTNDGVGWSWGIGFIRYGISPNGRRWVSVGIPGTGLRYFKYLNTNHRFSKESRTDNTSQKIREWKNIK